MLELIVLGQIPGTTITIGYQQALIALLFALLIIVKSRTGTKSELTNQQEINDQAL